MKAWLWGCCSNELTIRFNAEETKALVTIFAGFNELLEALREVKLPEEEVYK